MLCVSSSIRTQATGDLRVPDPERPLQDESTRTKVRRRLAFEAISQAIEYDGLTKTTGMQLLRRVEHGLLLNEVVIDEERCQDLLAWATEGGDV